MPTYRNNNTYDLQLTSRVSPTPTQFTIKAGKKQETDGYYQIEGLELLSHEPVYSEIGFSYNQEIFTGTLFEIDGVNFIDIISTKSFSITYNRNVAGMDINSGVERFAAGAYVQIDNRKNLYVNIYITPLDVDTKLSVNYRKV